MVDTDCDDFPEDCDQLCCPCKAAKCPICPIHQVSCSGHCIDVTNDDNNCGSCGASCDVGLGKHCVGAICKL
jgi:hypothetical protein